MAKVRTRSGNGNRTMTSVGTAEVELTPTLKGAWRTRFSYLAFGETEDRPGPSGLGQFVVAQLLAFGVGDSDQAEFVRWLADPPSVHGDTELPDAFDRLGITVNAPTGELLASSGVDADLVSRVANGDSEVASVPKGREEELLDLFRQRPGDGASKAKWREWYRRAAQLPVTVNPRGFEIPDKDPLHKAYDFESVPVTGSPVEAS